MEHREISKLKVNPGNPRGVVEVDDALRELAASIQEQGVLQPILITPDDMIVIGHRRTKAAELAGLRTIPVTVRKMSRSQQLQVMLIENLQREGLTTMQTALAYQTLIAHGLSIREIAKATGFGATSISRHLDILSLPKELQLLFDGGSLPLGSAPYLVTLKTADQKIRVGKEAAAKDWLLSEIAAAVEEIRHPQPKRAIVGPPLRSGNPAPAPISLGSDSERTTAHPLTASEVKGDDFALKCLARAKSELTRRRAFAIATEIERIEEMVVEWKAKESERREMTTPGLSSIAGTIMRGPSPKWKSTRRTP